MAQRNEGREERSRCGVGQVYDIGGLPGGTQGSIGRVVRAVSDVAGNRGGRGSEHAVARRDQVRSVAGRSSLHRRKTVEKGAQGGAGDRPQSGGRKRRAREPFLFVLPRSFADTIRCSPWSGAFPPQPPPPAFRESCSAASLVLRPCSTPHQRACTDCAFASRADPAAGWPPDAGEVSRFSRVQFSDVLLVLGLRRACERLALASSPVWPSR